MFVRASTSKGTNQQLDAGIALVREQIDPSLRTRPGYVGMVTLLDRENGVGIAASYWQTAADLSASEDVGQEGRVEAAQRTGLQLIDVDRFEHILIDRIAPPSANVAFARTTELRGSPDKIDSLKPVLDRSVSTDARSRGIVRRSWP